MPLYLKIAVILHGDEKIIPGAEQAVKNFVDKVRQYSNKQLEIYAEFVKVGFGPPLETFAKDATYGYFAREGDLKKVLDDVHPCCVVRIYDHGLSEDAFRKIGKLPTDWSISALALTYGINPPYTAIAWDTWLKAQGSEPIENILIHEFIHQLEALFRSVKITTFMGSHNGVSAYPDSFKTLDDSFKTPVPWAKLDPLIGADWKA